MEKHTRRSSLFLLELIIAIAFFSLAAAICVQLFVKSHSIEKEAYELQKAVNLATSAAETFRSTDVEPFVVYYDENWSECAESEAFYTLELGLEASNFLQKAQISVKANNSPIYELEVLKNANLEVDKS